MKKLKIGIICYLSVGGLGIIVIEFGKQFVEKGYEIYFIMLSILFRLNIYYFNIYFYEVEVN